VKEEMLVRSSLTATEISSTTPNKKPEEIKTRCVKLRIDYGSTHKASRDNQLCSNKPRPQSMRHRPTNNKKAYRPRVRPVFFLVVERTNLSHRLIVYFFSRLLINNFMPERTQFCISTDPA
jgi:hypothetical protein